MGPRWRSPRSSEAGTVSARGLSNFRRLFLRVRRRSKCRVARRRTRNHEIVRRAKALAPRLRTAATFAIPGRGHLTARAIISAIERAEADEAALHYGLATRRTVAALHERGISVVVWTANSKLVMRRMLAVGVDAMMTNYPNRLADVLASNAGKRD